MPISTAPNYGIHNPAPKEDVIALANAVRLLYPGAIVKAMDDDSPAWVQQIVLPISERSGVSINVECNAWAAFEYWPSGRRYLDHANPTDLISVIRDAFAYIHRRARALGA